MSDICNGILESRSVCDRFDRQVVVQGYPIIAWKLGCYWLGLVEAGHAKARSVGVGEGGSRSAALASISFVSPVDSALGSLCCDKLCCL